MQTSRRSLYPYFCLRVGARGGAARHLKRYGVTLGRTSAVRRMKRGDRGNIVCEN